MKTIKTLLAQHANLVAWQLPLVGLCLAAAILRLAYLGYDLPSEVGNDEYFYHVWARAIKETGRPNVDHGAGYPPAFLCLLAFEQGVVEVIRSPAYHKGIDDFLFARAINALFGVASVGVAALLGRGAARSTIAGLSVGALVAALPLFVDESRRAAANAPWLFYTLLAFYFLLRARDANRIRYLHLALLSGAISFLFKYQSGVLLALPFLYAFIYFRRPAGRLYPHLLIWLLVVLGLFSWLIFDYGIFDVVNTPGSDTASYVQEGRVVGFQSLGSNWASAKSQLNHWTIVGAFLAVTMAMVLSQKKKGSAWLDAGAVLTLAFFAASFFLVMSLFRPVAYSKWLVFAGVINILGVAGWVASLRFVVEVGEAALGFSPQRLVGALLVAFFFLWVSVFGREQWGYWASTYHDAWSKPRTTRALNDWLRDYAPQGGRVVSEGQRIVVRYIYEHYLFHTLQVDSIFDETVQSYRERGYEYLVWNSLKSGTTDSLADLDAKRQTLIEQGAKEVIRLYGPDYFGPDIVVFQIDPVQQHPLFAWFTPAISFRGYDLNSETFKAGDSLELMLYWMSAERTTANYIVFVHLLFDDGKTLLAGQDGPPDYGNRPTWKWEGDMQFIRDQRLLSIPADAPPGKYILRMGMYDADTKLRAQITSPQGQPFGDTLTLQEIEIEK